MQLPDFDIKFCGCKQGFELWPSSYCFSSSAFTSWPSSYLNRGQCPGWTPSHIQGHFGQVSLVAKRIDNHLTVLSHDQNPTVSDCYCVMYFKQIIKSSNHTNRLHWFLGIKQSIGTCLTCRLTHLQKYRYTVTIIRTVSIKQTPFSYSELVYLLLVNNYPHFLLFVWAKQKIDPRVGRNWNDVTAHFRV